MAFVFKKLKIPDVVVIQADIHTDERGFFMEVYKFSEFAKKGLDIPFIQDSYSVSTKNVLRGLHYQLNPKSQGKLIRCTKGEIFDVAVDIREGSKSYGKWVGVVLSECNTQLYIPPGFAHGFCVLTDVAEISYKQTCEYSPEHERGILWNDPKIAIDWPIDSPIITERDNSFPILKSAENNYI